MFNTKLVLQSDVNVMLQSRERIETAPIYFAPSTKPLSLATSFLYFPAKLHFMDYRVLARGILHIYAAAECRVASRRATVPFCCRGMRRKSRNRLCYKEKILL